MTNCKGGLIEPTNCYARPALVLSLLRTAQQQLTTTTTTLFVPPVDLHDTKNG